jgi:hypothetical protein
MSPGRGVWSLKEPQTTFLVGAVADPTKHSVLKGSVGRAAVPASTGSISGCELARDHTPRLGLKQTLVAVKGLYIV